jgi:hypothetical protein
MSTMEVSLATALPEPSCTGWCFDSAREETSLGTRVQLLYYEDDELLQSYVYFLRRVHGGVQARSLDFPDLSFEGIDEETCLGSIVEAFSAERRVLSLDRMLIVEECGESPKSLYVLEHRPPSQRVRHYVDISRLSREVQEIVRRELDLG